MYAKILSVAIALGTLSGFPSRARAESLDGEVEKRCDAAERSAQLTIYCALFEVVGHLGSGEFYRWGKECGREYFSATGNQSHARKLIELLLPADDPLRASLLQLIPEPPSFGGGYPVLQGPRGGSYVSCGYTDNMLSTGRGLVAGQIIACPR